VSIKTPRLIRDRCGVYYFPLIVPLALRELPPAGEAKMVAWIRAHPEASREGGNVGMFRLPDTVVRQKFDSMQAAHFDNRVHLLESLRLCRKSGVLLA